MNLPRLFFLDFDGTLFKTELFWRDVRKACAQKLPISEELFLETYEKAKSLETVYDIDVHIKLLGISREEMMSIITSVFTQKSYMFDDVIPFLDMYASDTFVIVTQGVEWFQRTKISSLSLDGRDIPIVVTNYKKRLFIENTVDFDGGVKWRSSHYKSLTFVDNMADAFLLDSHNGTLLQYRIRRFEDDIHAVDLTRPESIEITTLLNIV